MMVLVMCGDGCYHQDHYDQNDTHNDHHYHAHHHHHHYPSSSSLSSSPWPSPSPSPLLSSLPPSSAVAASIIGSHFAALFGGVFRGQREGRWREALRFPGARKSARCSGVNGCRGRVRWGFSQERWGYLHLLETGKPKRGLPGRQPGCERELEIDLACTCTTSYIQFICSFWVSVCFCLISASSPMGKPSDPTLKEPFTRFGCLARLLFRAIRNRLPF